MRCPPDFVALYTGYYRHRPRRAAATPFRAFRGYMHCSLRSFCGRKSGGGVGFEQNLCSMRSSHRVPRTGGGLFVHELYPDSCCAGKSALFMDQLTVAAAKADGRKTIIVCEHSTTHWMDPSQVTRQRTTPRLYSITL